MKRSFRKYALIVLTAVLFSGIQADSQAVSPREYQIKAAFIFNFTKFIDWPADAYSDNQKPFIMGILGENPFGDALAPLLRKRVKGRVFEIKPIRGVEAAEDCHILFISRSEKDALQTVFEHLKGRSILTVGETESFVLRGGVINFFTLQNTIRFEINLSAAERAHLKISSKLLKLAKVFKEATP